MRWHRISAAQRNFLSALKLSVYSFTPVWLAGIFLLIPGLRFLTILGLYGVYLLWSGLPALMRAPREATIACTALVAVTAIIMHPAAGWPAKHRSAVAIAVPPSG